MKDDLERARENKGIQPKGEVLNVVKIIAELVDRYFLVCAIALHHLSPTSKTRPNN
jgi:hypothetical protein